MTPIDQWFGVPGDISIAQECARAGLVFAYGVAAVRLAGRRIFAAWSAADIIVAIVFGSSRSRTLTGNAPLVGTLVATSLLLLLHALVSRLASRSRMWSRLFEGRPVDLSAGGEIVESVRKRYGISPLVIREALHQAGIDQVDEARRLVLEPSGKISIVRDAIPPEQHQAVVSESPHV